MKNSADLGGFYPSRPSASVDNTLLDLQNSSYPTQPHSIIAKYNIVLVIGTRDTSEKQNRFFWNKQTAYNNNLGAFLWTDLDLDQRSRITQILVHRKSG